jgi:nucleotide-binding universal stress UspA family protein
MADSRLQEQLRKTGEAGAQIAGTYARVGFSDAEIVGLAGKLGAGLIVLGSRGRGPLKRALMGSVSDSVVRYAHYPILVVRTQRLVTMLSRGPTSIPGARGSSESIS